MNDIPKRVAAELTTLDGQLERIEAALRRLRAVNVIDAAAVSADLVEAATRVKGIRSALSEVDPAGPDEFPSRERFAEHLAAVESKLASQELRVRSALAALAAYLGAGSIVHRSPRILAAKEASLAGALAEVRAAAGMAAPTELPGPTEPSHWLAWAWERRDDTLDLPGYPLLKAFVVDVDASEWRPATATSVATPAAEMPDATTPPPTGETAQTEGAKVAATASSAAGAVEGNAIPFDPVTSPRSPNEISAPPSAMFARADVKDPNPSAEPAAVPPSEEAATVTMASVPPSEQPQGRAEAIEAPLRADAGAPDPEPLPTAPRARQGNGTSSDSPRAIPEELGSLRAFAHRYFVGANHEVTPAPWLDAARFTGQLRRVQLRAVASSDYAMSLLLAATMEESFPEIPPLFSTRTVRALAEVDRAPASETAGVDPERSQGLSIEVFSPTARPREDLRVAVALEALRPSAAIFNIAGRTQDLVERADFHCHELGQVFEFLLESFIQGHAPLERLRGVERAAKAVSREQLQTRLADARSAYHDLVTSLWSAAGGRIQQTHCRAAWAAFIEANREELRRLFPENRGGANKWDARAMAERLGRVYEDFETLADHHGAKFTDRQRMNRAVRQMVDAADGVNSIALAIDRLADVPTPRAERISKDVLQKLRVSALDRPEEELCRRLLFDVLDERKPRTTEPFEFTVSHLLRWPRLLPLASNSLGVTADGSTSPLAQEELSAPLSLSFTPSERLEAVSIVLFDTPEPRGTTPRPASAVLADWYERNDWPEFAVLLAPVGGPDEKRHLSRERERLMSRLQEQAGRLRIAWRTLDGAASLLAQPLATVRKEVDDTLDEKRFNIGAFRLASTWLERLIRLAESEAARQQQRLNEKAKSAGQNTALEALARGDALLGAFAVAAPSAARERVRQTDWRHVARAAHPDSLVSIRRLKEAREGEFLDAWLRGITMKSSDGQLRRLFVEFVFADRELKLQIEKKDRSIPTADLRRYLAKKQLNPSFIPQLGRFKRVVCLASPVKVDEATFAQKTVNSITSFPGDMVFVLAPRVTEQRRQEFFVELRSRGRVPAAIIDDLDLLRLFGPNTPAPNPVIGLIELFLEQQSAWTDVSPFAVSEGQHVQMEMYVGRRDEARRLASTADYSRLFSGRKLGKSALLRYVEDTYDHHRLASGNTLRVLYVLITGMRTELPVVEAIFRVLNQRTGFVHDFTPTEATASEHLQRGLRRFIAEKGGESLLLVLDEADSFVEDQLERDGTDRETSLSWTMRTLEGEKDPGGFPRLRFVLAGYRQTQTTGGAWANWGDVMVLPPLSPEDAANLVEAPFARLGIDVSVQAPAIAWRCGYQAAVLLKFGIQLLEHLDRTRSHSQRSKVAVTADDVAEVFNHNAIQEEIRTVVRNNFHGDDVARVVFLALLREFEDAGPSEALSDAAGAILQRLKSVCGDVSWLQNPGGSAVGTVERLLRDFERRKLITQKEERRTRSHSLRFPHHLRLVLGSNPDEEIRAEARALSAPDRARRRSGPEWRTVFDPREIENARYALAEPDCGVVAIIGASSFAPFLDLHGRGLAEQLGFLANHVRDGGNEQAADSHQQLYVRAVTPDKAGRILAERAEKRMPPPVLTGNAALLRWALGAAHRDGTFIELVSTGRLHLQALEWWFTRALGWEFPSGSALGELHRATGGIPLLVGAAQLELEKRGDDTKSAQDVAAALDRLRQSLPQVALSLLNGDTRLESRELQILRMAHTVIQNGSDRVTVEDLTADWDVLHRDGLKDAPPLDYTDHVALAVLQRLGLLPVAGDVVAAVPLDRFAPVFSGDPLFRLVAGLSST